MTQPVTVRARTTSGFSKAGKPMSGCFPYTPQFNTPQPSTHWKYKWNALPVKQEALHNHLQKGEGIWSEWRLQQYAGRDEGSGQLAVIQMLWL